MTIENRREKDRITKNQAEHRGPARLKTEWLVMAGLLVMAASISAVLLPWVGHRFSASLEPPPAFAETQEIPGWNLLLVNPWNSLPEGYQVQLTDLGSGERIDRRCYHELQDMLDACRAAGMEPLICSAYRSQETQERLFADQVELWTSQGVSLEEARAEAGKVVAVPGTSEHQLGLAVDIVDITNQILDESQENTPTQQWLMENSWKYGFILRYPNEKSNITGIIYEPWHYRYVGKEAAAEIYQQGLCLEEYLETREVLP